jgi:hypothetical protein
MGQCCCGRIHDCDEPVRFNEYVHEPLGPEGNFCGPAKNHTIRDQDLRINELQLMLEYYVEKVEDISKPKASAHYIEAIFTEMILDAGQRGRKVLDKNV